MTTMAIRGVSLFVKVIGHGYPLVLMHGGPSLDHVTLLPLQSLADQFTLIFYHHRCNGRSGGGGGHIHTPSWCLSSAPVTIRRTSARRNHPGHQGLHGE